MGATLQQLADTLGTDHANVSRMEAGGRAMRPDQIEALAARLGLWPGDLFRHPDAEAPSTPEETALLRAFRAVRPGDRATALRLLQALAQQGQAQGDSPPYQPPEAKPKTLHDKPPGSPN